MRDEGRVRTDLIFCARHPSMDGVTHYSAVDLEALPLAEKPGKIDNTLVVPFSPPVRIQTDLLTAVTPLSTRAEDGTCEVLPSLTARASGDFLAFLKKFEAAVLATAKANAGKWWPRRNLDAGVIENGHKTYMKGKDVFKLKVDFTGDPIVWNLKSEPQESDVLTPGQQFWAVLEAQRVVIGRSEFGLVWRLHQVMHKPMAACVVRPQEARQRPSASEMEEFG